MSSATELLARRELLWNLTLREMRGRYKRSVLGWAWSMLNPLATMVIYTFVFSVVLQTPPPLGDPSGLEQYALFLVCGLLAWNFVSISVTVSLTSIVDNGGLVKKVAFPREHLVVATVLSGLATLGFELVALTVVLLAFGNFVLPWLPLVVVTALIASLFATGLGLALAAANVYFRDLQYLWGIVTQAWFFSTPVVYPAYLVEDQVPSWVFQIYERLPMAVLVRVFRNLLYDLRIPSIVDYGYLLIYGIVALLAGWWLFDRLEGRFAEEL